MWSQPRKPTLTRARLVRTVGKDYFHSGCIDHTPPPPPFRFRFPLHAHTYGRPAFLNRVCQICGGDLAAPNERVGLQRRHRSFRHLEVSTTNPKIYSQLFSSHSTSANKMTTTVRESGAGYLRLSILHRQERGRGIVSALYEGGWAGKCVRCLGVFSRYRILSQ